MKKKVKVYRKVEGAERLVFPKEAEMLKKEGIVTDKPQKKEEKKTPETKEYKKKPQTKSK